MRHVLIVCAALATSACSKESKQSSPPTATAPAAPASSTAAADQPLELGKPSLVASGQSYRVGDVSIRIGRISMANGVDNQGRETHALMMDLEVTRSGAAPVKLGLSGDEPSEAAGLVFRADALGYQWGKSPATATLRVDRK